MTAEKFDAIVIGGGADALVAASVLGKAGRRVLCLVREQSVAGLHSLIDIAPGFKAGLGLEADWVPPSVMRELDIIDMELVAPEIPTSVALPDGGFLSLSGNPTEAATAIRVHAPADAGHWGAFTRTMRELSGFLEALYQIPPTDLDSTSLGDIPSLLSLGRSFRSLGKANMSELLRVMPIPAQDLADDWFTFGPLKAAIGAAAVRDIRQGPRSGGTSFVLLHYLAGATDGSIRGRPWLRIGVPHPDTFITAAQQSARAARRHDPHQRGGVADRRPRRCRDRSDARQRRGDFRAVGAVDRGCGADLPAPGRPRLARSRLSARGEEHQVSRQHRDGVLRARVPPRHSRTGGSGEGPVRRDQPLVESRRDRKGVRRGQVRQRLRTSTCGDQRAVAPLAGARAVGEARARRQGAVRAAHAARWRAMGRGEVGRVGRCGDGRDLTRDAKVHRRHPGAAGSHAARSGSAVRHHRGRGDRRRDHARSDSVHAPGRRLGTVRHADSRAVSWRAREPILGQEWSVRLVCSRRVGCWRMGNRRGGSNDEQHLPQDRRSL